MSNSASRLAIIALGVFTLLPAAKAVSAQEIADLGACQQAVKDALTARDQNPKIGDKSEAIFNDLVKQAQEFCDQQKFKEASAHLNVARGMVASD